MYYCGGMMGWFVFPYNLETKSNQIYITKIVNINNIFCSVFLTCSYQFDYYLFLKVLHIP